MWTRLFACEQLQSRELAEFMENDLGNLPLSVALCGHMLRADDKMTSVQDFVTSFRHDVELDAVDTRGFNPQTDTHYFGLTRSVLFAISRVQRSTSYTEE